MSIEDCDRSSTVNKLHSQVRRLEIAQLDGRWVCDTARQRETFLIYPFAILSYHTTSVTVTMTITITIAKPLKPLGPLQSSITLN